MIRLRYQLIISLPKNKAKNVPTTKNGPKGTSLCNVFLPKIIIPMPIIAPLKKAENKPTKIFGQPRIKPIRKTSLTSASPIHLPREIRNIVPKNNAAPRALKIEDWKIGNPLKIKN